MFPGFNVVKLGDALGKYLGLKRKKDGGPLSSFNYDLVADWDIGWDCGPELSRQIIINSLKEA